MRNTVEILDWIFTVLVSFFILGLIFSVIYLFSLLKTQKRLKKLKKNKPKNKKKRKKWVRQRKKGERQRKKQLRLVLFFIIGSLICGATAAYSRYYQATNLGEKDSDAIIQGYHLINGIQKQLDQIDDKKYEVKIQKNLYDLSARLSSYGARNADRRLSPEGQLLLNRFYANMKELGLNINNQSVDSLRNKKIMDGYDSDLTKAKQNQEKVFTYFHIDERALTEVEKND